LRLKHSINICRIELSFSNYSVILKACTDWKVKDDTGFSVLTMKTEKPLQTPFRHQVILGLLLIRGVGEFNKIPLQSLLSFFLSFFILVLDF
jgi:hypothetical protein